MKPLYKKIIAVCCLSFFPLLILTYQNFFHYRKGWHTPAIQYQAIFWMVRLVVSPLLACLIIKYWKESGKSLFFLVTQIAGFILYLVVCWGLSFVLCQTLSSGFDGRNLNLFNIIKNESSLLDLLIYVATVSILYRWLYLEQHSENINKTFRLEQSLAEAINNLSRKQEKTEPVAIKEKPDHIAIKAGYKTIIIPMRDIACFLADGPYIKVITGKMTYLLKKPLYELQAILPVTFLRVHRSHIVNSEFIREVKSLLNGDYTLLLKNGTEIRASRTYREMLKNMMGKS